MMLCYEDAALAYKWGYTILRLSRNCILQSIYSEQLKWDSEMKLLASRLWAFRAKPSSTPNAENAENDGFSMKKCRKLQKCVTVQWIVLFSALFHWKIYIFRIFCILSWAGSSCHPWVVVGDKPSSAQNVENAEHVGCSRIKCRKI